MDYDKILYSAASWAKEPSQTVNYASAHDNLTLRDKLSLSAQGSSREERIRMNLLSAAIVLTSQGIPFFQAGEELLRSKPLKEEGRHFEDNSYRSPDTVNSIKWNDRTTNKEVFEYYKGLVAFRKAHKALRMERSEEIRSCLRFQDITEPMLVAYMITGNKATDDKAADHKAVDDKAADHKAVDDKATDDKAADDKAAVDKVSASVHKADSSAVEEIILTVFNANKETKQIEIPEGSWKVYVKGKRAGTETLEEITGGNVMIEPISTLIMVKDF